MDIEHSSIQTCNIKCVFELLADTGYGCSESASSSQVLGAFDKSGAVGAAFCLVNTSGVPCLVGVGGKRNIPFRIEISCGVARFEFNAERDAD